MTHTNLLPSGLGAIYTRAWAVDLVLDLAGYTRDHDLATKRAVEPSCGGGAFIAAMINRLALSCRLHSRRLEETEDAIWARDIDPHAVTATRTVAQAALMQHGVSAVDASRLARSWIQEGDFLLEPCPPADWVLGNPPYVRLEDIGGDRYAKYKARWSAMAGRADIYVGFIQAGLEALTPGGTLAYICADRWMRNQYGRRLRKEVEDGFSVDAVVTLHASDPFETSVSAYPAAFAISNAKQGPVLVAETDSGFGGEGASHLVNRIHRGGPTGQVVNGPGYSASWLRGWFTDTPSWPAGSPDRLNLVAELEQRHPVLDDPRHGIRVGIGLTTGADGVFLTKSADAFESPRLLPMVMASNIKTGSVVWDGTHLVNPWQDKSLVDLRDFPRTAAHFTAHEPQLRARHVGRRQPERWYRTIDRPANYLAATPKLLVADLRPRVTPVLDDGEYYPHHNLYWVTSAKWDLRVLGGLLLSDFGTLFVETYSPRMAGGALRVTAQYLRRICVPEWESVPITARVALAEAFETRDVTAATSAAAAAYGLRSGPM